MKKSPVVQVREQFGSKEALADKLIPMLDRPEGEDEGDFKRRIRTASNKQLLRLWKAEETVKGLGGKEKLLDEIVQLKFGRANGEYRTKIARFANSRLLDLHASLKKGAKS